jgi:nicotinamide/nicotinate riboside kinase
MGRAGVWRVKLCEIFLMFLVGIGGSSCSGKSTITNWISQLLQAPIIHQDGFFRPDSKIPLLDGIPNWDCPEVQHSNQAIDFEAFHEALRKLREGSVVEILGPNRPKLEQGKIPSEKVLELVKQLKSIKQSIVLIDGFMLYQNYTTIDLLHLHIFLHAPFEVLKDRRNQRKTYVTPEGHWQDPPNYFEKVVWPMYLQNNSLVLDSQFNQVKRIDSHQNSIEQVLELVLEAILDAISSTI